MVYCNFQQKKKKVPGKTGTYQRSEVKLAGTHFVEIKHNLGQSNQATHANDGEHDLEPHGPFSHRSPDVVVWGFLGNLHVMDVRFADTSRGDFDEASFFVHLGN